MPIFETHWQPATRDLRIFGCGGAVLCAVFGLLRWAQTQQFAVMEILLLAAAILLGLISWKVPRGLYPVHWLLVRLFFPVGWLFSLSLLAFAFFAVLTPLGLVMRLLGRDALKRRIDPKAETYWEDHSPQDSLEDYFRQF